MDDEGNSKEDVEIAFSQERDVADIAAEEPKTKNEWDTFTTLFTHAKAGMQAVDKERVKKVVFEMSKARIF